jgi:ABC-type transport system involved in Fe-S cluster assembly, ATPase component
MLRAENLNATVDGEVFLSDVSLSAELGKIHVVMGRTGSG